VLTLPRGAEVSAREERKLVLRFDREQASASQVAASLMGQVEVADFSISEPDLSGIVKQIYAGGLAEQPEEVPA
jgi:ABC-2 type transport system ATP-binding protein